jgi:hypothetical protein
MGNAPPASHDASGGRAATVAAGASTFSTRAELVRHALAHNLLDET